MQDGAKESSEDPEVERAKLSALLQFVVNGSQSDFENGRILMETPDKNKMMTHMEKVKMLRLGRTTRWGEFTKEMEDRFPVKHTLK